MKTISISTQHLSHFSMKMHWLCFQSITGSLSLPSLPTYLACLFAEAPLGFQALYRHDCPLLLVIRWKSFVPFLQLFTNPDIFLKYLQKFLWHDWLNFIVISTQINGLLTQQVKADNLTMILFVMVKTKLASVFQIFVKVVCGSTWLSPCEFTTSLTTLHTAAEPAICAAVKT